MASNVREPRLFHLALRDDWRVAVEHGDYQRSTLGKSLDDEGFIHCSFASQVQRIADGVYRDRQDVVLLTIDPSRLSAEVRVESFDADGEPFPHIYGPLPIDAVVLAQSVPVAADGRLVLEQLVSTANDS
jgi:glutathione S-transferase